MVLCLYLGHNKMVSCKRFMSLSHHLKPPGRPRDPQPSDTSAASFPALGAEQTFTSASATVFGRRSVFKPLHPRWQTRSLPAAGCAADGLGQPQAVDPVRCPPSASARNGWRAPRLQRRDGSAPWRANAVIALLQAGAEPWPGAGLGPEWGGYRREER